MSAPSEEMESGAFPQGMGCRFKVGRNFLPEILRAEPPNQECRVGTKPAYDPETFGRSEEAPMIEHPVQNTPGPVTRHALLSTPIGVLPVIRVMAHGLDASALEATLDAAHAMTPPDELYLRHVIAGDRRVWLEMSGQVSVHGR